MPAGVWLIVGIVGWGSEPTGAPLFSAGASSRPASPTDRRSTTSSRPSSGTVGAPNLLTVDGGFEMGPPHWCGFQAGDDLCMPGAIDRQDAYEGGACARWLIEPEQGGGTIRIPLVVSDREPGQTYCVSLALRSSSPQSVRAALSDDEAARPTRWSVLGQWTQEHMTFKWPASSSVPALVLHMQRPDHPWALWLDAIKVEAGSSPTPYRPPEKPLVAAELGRSCGLLFADSPVSVRASVYRPREHRDRAVKLRWELTDGHRIVGTGEVTLSDRDITDAGLCREALEPGRYRLTLELIDAKGRAAICRTETFCVVEDLRKRPAGSLRLCVASRGPRSDEIARRLGLTVEAESRPAAPATSGTPTHGEGISLPPAGSVAPTAQERIRQLTAARLDGVATVRWPTAWSELLDASGKWRPVAAAVNTWLRVLGEAKPLRRTSLNGGVVRIDVFSESDTTSAFVSVGDRREPSGVGPIPPGACLEIPLSDDDLCGLDLYGARLPIAGRGGRSRVDLPLGGIYLLAGPNLTRGRFALQLEEAQLVAAVTSRRSAATVSRPATSPSERQLNGGTP